MAMIVIDLVGGEETLVESTSRHNERHDKEEKEHELLRKRALDEYLRRAPQPQIIPVTNEER